MSQIQKLGPNSGGPVGDVVGPASSTDGAIALFDGTTGKLIKESLMIQQCTTITTTDATPTNMFTIALDATQNAVYEFEARISAYDVTDDVGGGYFVYGAIRTNGTDSTICGVPDVQSNEEVTMEDADINAVAGGLGDNNLYIELTGIAATTINWSGCITTIKVT